MPPTQAATEVQTTLSSKSAGNDDGNGGIIVLFFIILPYLVLGVIVILITFSIEHRHIRSTRENRNYNVKSNTMPIEASTPKKVEK
jgi:heme/copper-type cytochrome/quinol oxidase subunit 2